MKAVARPEVEYANLHQDLIDGCRSGDQKSQFQIYKLYYKAMYNTSLRIVRDPMEAEDIMQEAFLSAFERIGSYSGSVSFGAWLRKIVHNRSLDYLRKNSKIVCEEIEAHYDIADTLEEFAPDEDHDPRMKKVLDIIKGLPEKYREILSLYLFEGYDHEEIGEILSIPSSTSRSNYSRAKSKLIGKFENA